jgi:hypothetical protein
MIPPEMDEVAEKELPKKETRKNEVVLNLDFGRRTNTEREN